ncbi:MAG: hypothetical protein A3A22_02100 [Candidatus Taylorbacteria bacterium RIFCSPLOWO2_01_FULL_45_34b]|nr:MAG: hypothetical protein A3A22_02100 [Candidatus Taylorbacteria bacterium RIFCSPLOWO2_01_FULL_45_34b]
MQLDTLIIGYVPLSDVTGKKPRELKEDKYFRELLAEFDLGTVHYADWQNWKAKIDELNPLVIISLGGEYYAEQVKEYKKDSLLYAVDDAGSVFYRKANIEEKKNKHKKIFSEIAGIIQKMRDGGEKEVAAARKYSAMSYKDMYNMLIQAIIGKDEKLRQSAWELLMNNNGHKNFVWMRAQLICETWDHADGKGKEQFLCMAMDQHIDEGIARKMDDFTDADGQQFHQYMFCDLFGCDMNYIRRIPFGTKGQDKWAYQKILDTYETPNGPQMMLESGQMRGKKSEYFKSEAEKVCRVLKAWKDDHTKSKKELGVVPWCEEDSDDDPLTERELASLKGFLKKHDLASYESLFETPD